jgi:hypothetical protein
MSTFNDLAVKLHKYDAMKAELRKLETELSRGCAAYGVNKGIWGFRIDHFRMEVQQLKDVVRG